MVEQDNTDREWIKALMDYADLRPNLNKAEFLHEIISSVLNQRIDKDS